MKIQDFPIPDGAPGTGVSGTGIPEHPGIGEHTGIGAPTGHPNQNLYNVQKILYHIT